MNERFDDSFSLPRMVDLPDIARPDTPGWLVRALDLYADHNLPNDEKRLRGQFTENRMFLCRVERERLNGELAAKDLRSMEEAFARACAEPEGDPMLAVEKIYLDAFYARQPRRTPAMAMQSRAR